MHYISQVHTYK